MAIGKGAADLVVMAVIIGAHGVRGDVRIKSFSEVPADAFSYGPLLDEQGAVCVTPKKARKAKDHFVVSPEEFRQKEDWDGMKGRLLHVPRDVLPETDDNEVYIDELVGVRVCDETGAVIGKVKAVHNFGAGDLLEIAPVTGGKTVMVPFTEEDVPEVDLNEGKIVAAAFALWADDSAERDED